MAIGKITSYATTDKSPNYLGDVASQFREDIYRDRQFNQDKEDKEAQNKALADKAKAESDKAKNEQFDKFLTPYSGVSTVDGMAIVATTQLAKAVADSQKEVDAGRKTQLEHNLLKTKVASDIGLLKINNDRIKAEAESYQKLVQEGKINPAFDAKYQQFNNDYQKGNFAYVFNPNGDSKMIRYENNEFGIPQGKEEISWGDFTTNKERTVLNNDFNNDIKDFKIANPAEKIEILGYDTKTGTKQLTQQGREAIALRVQEHLHNPDDLSNAYLAATGNAEKDITDPEKIKVSQDYLIKRYEKSYGVEKTVDEATGRANLNETKKQHKIDNEKDEQSFTTTPEIPLAFKNAGVSQGKDLTMVVENGKAKPSLSFTDKNTGKVINLQNVIPQKVSRVKEGDRYVYVTEVSHLKPTRVYAEGGEDLGGGKIAKKGDLLGTTDIQTSEVVRLKEANALNLLKSKTIKTKEDLRNIFPKENVQQDVENNSIPTYNISDLKNNGWNDSQIKQAVREGKIKTK